MTIGGSVTVKLCALEVRAAVITVTDTMPAGRLLGTVAVSMVEDIKFVPAVTVPKFTDASLRKPTPATVTLKPPGPLVGERPGRDGATVTAAVPDQKPDAPAGVVAGA